MALYAMLGCAYVDLRDMLRGAMQCYAMLCYAMQCYAMLCYAMLCYAMLCYAMLGYAMLCYVRLHYGILIYVMMCCVVLCVAFFILIQTEYHLASTQIHTYLDLSTVSCDVMLRYAMLDDAMQCYAML